MKNALLLIFLLVVIQSNAQNTWRYGVLASIENRGIPDCSCSSSSNSGKNFFPSFSVGGFIEKKITKNFSVSVEPSYENLGISKYDKYSSSQVEYINRFSTIHIPLVVTINISRKIYFDFGVAPVYILTGKKTSIVTNPSKVVVSEINYTNLDQKFGSPRVQFPILLGFGYKLSKKIDVSFRAYVATQRYTYTGLDFFEPCPTCDPDFISTKQNQGLALRMKYNFAK